MRIKSLLAVLGVGFAFAAMYFLPLSEPVKAQSDGALTGLHKVTGWGWSSNVGWVKFDPSGGGVTIDATGSNASAPVFSGWAWSNNLGWIKFSPDYSGPSGASDPHGAKLVGNTVKGWAKAATAASGGANTTQAGGWDGWIKLSGSASDGGSYGVVKEGMRLTGFAWGALNMGWLKFHDVLIQPCDPNDSACQPPDCPENPTFADNPECFCEENPDDPRCDDCPVNPTYEDNPTCYCEKNPGDSKCGGCTNPNGCGGGEIGVSCYPVIEGVSYPNYTGTVKVKSGTKMQWRATPLGGTAPYSYLWQNGSGWSFSDPNRSGESVIEGTYTYNPDGNNTYSGYVTVTDSAGDTSGSTLCEATVIEVEPEAKPPYFILELAPANQRMQVVRPPAGAPCPSADAANPYKHCSNVVSFRINREPEPGVAAPFTDPIDLTVTAGVPVSPLSGGQSKGNPSVTISPSRSTGNETHQVRAVFPDRGVYPWDANVSSPYSIERGSVKICATSGAVESCKSVPFRYFDPRSSDY